MHRRVPDHRRCTATTKDGRRCQLWRFGGGEHCFAHDEEAQELLVEFREWLHSVRRVKVGPGFAEATDFDVDRWRWEKNQVT